MIRYILRGLLALVVLAIVVAIGALSYRAWRQHENAAVLAITAPNGVDERSFVRINGIDQYITIRGEDRRNPVILMLAGGPGNSMVQLGAVFRHWEKYFTIVQWDQRGAGKTYELMLGKTTPGQTIAQMTADGISLTEFLRVHLHKDKVILLGVSWGTMLGLRIVKARPDLYSAYVGTGQVVAQEPKEEFLYASLLKKVHANGDADSAAALERIGPPPYRSADDAIVERNVSSLYDIPVEQNLNTKLTPTLLFAPQTSLLDIYCFLASTNDTVRVMWNEVSAYDARKLGTDFGVPMFVFNGDHDAIAPMSFSQAWLATVRAPQKAFVVLKGGGHRAILSMPDVFLRELLARVCPLASEAGEKLRPHH